MAIYRWKISIRSKNIAIISIRKSVPVCTPSCYQGKIKPHCVGRLSQTSAEQWVSCWSPLWFCRVLFRFQYVHVGRICHQVTGHRECTCVITKPPLFFSEDCRLSHRLKHFCVAFVVLLLVWCEQIFFHWIPGYKNYYFPTIRTGVMILIIRRLDS